MGALKMEHAVQSKNDLILQGRNYGKVVLIPSIYTNTGAPALQVFGTEMYEGELIAVATAAYDPLVNPVTAIGEYATLIKDYSENEGIYSWLHEEGLIEPLPQINQPSGFVTLLGAIITNPTLRMGINAARAQHNASIQQEVNGG